MIEEDDLPPSSLSQDAARDQPNAILEARAWLRYGHRMLLRLAVTLVPWLDFWEYKDSKGKDKHLSFAHFEGILSIALAELATDYDDEKLARSVNATKKWIHNMRQHPQYVAIRDATADALRRLRQTRGIDSWAELMEYAAGKETAATALYGKGMAKQGAVDALIDRRSAKKGRGAEGAQVHIHLPPQFESTRDRALTIEAEILRREPRLLPSADDAIDASFVRVPDDET